jgi:hypothetical protein
MSETPYLIALLAVAAVLSAPLRAQEGIEESAPETLREAPTQSQPQVHSPEFGDPRFAFHRIDGGFLRLDLHTGAIASCNQNPPGWICVPGREERAALDHEIARLQHDNAVLKNALLERGVPLPDEIKAQVPERPITPVEPVPRPRQSVPPTLPKSAEPDHASRDDAEIDRVMGVMEKVWRRLVEMMLSIQRDMQKKG